MKKTILLILILVFGFAPEIAKADFTFGEPTNLGATVNSSAPEEGPSISVDGLTLYFNSDRTGGYGDFDLWMTTRETKEDPWGPPENLGSVVNSSAREMAPCISADDFTLYFYSNRTGSLGGGDIYQAPILPVVDFNGDGEVDRMDVGALMLNWGTSDSRYDIGPTPLGDGIVDSKDLMVLADHGAMLCGDVNFDGVVDLLDLAELSKNWLQDSNP